MPRIAFFLTFFLVISLELLYNKSFTFTNIFYKPSSDTLNIAIWVIVVIFCLLYISWLIFSVIRSIKESKKIGNQRRVITYTLLTAVSIVIFLVLLVASFFLGYDNSATIYLATIAYINFFVYLMALLYIPMPKIHLLDNRFVIVERKEFDDYKKLPEDPSVSDI